MNIQGLRLQFPVSPDSGAKPKPHRCIEHSGAASWVSADSPAATSLSATTPAAEHPTAMTSQGRKASSAEERRLTPSTLLK